MARTLDCRASCPRNEGIGVATLQTNPVQAARASVLDAVQANHVHGA